MAIPCKTAFIIERTNKITSPNGAIILQVRLLVGIGRYTDMSYGFQMLKDNHQFEHLLKKGLQKVRVYYFV